jgi:hypothetical protein
MGDWTYRRLHKCATERKRGTQDAICHLLNADGFQTIFYKRLDLLQVVKEERCEHCLHENIGCFVTNRTHPRKSGCYSCKPDRCSFGKSTRKDIDYHERLATGQVSKDILQPEARPAAEGPREHRTVYPLGTGPKASDQSDPDAVKREVCCCTPEIVCCADAPS